jgi:drug/metabolite transporter (DMT)-like permease
MPWVTAEFSGPRYRSHQAQTVTMQRVSPSRGDLESYAKRVSTGKRIRLFSAAMPPRLGALLAVAFWGLSFVATKAAVSEISPFALIFARAGLGTALLILILSRRSGEWFPPRESWPTLALMGFVGVAFHQAIQGFALTLTSAVHTGWLIGLTPIWSALLAAVVLHERFGAHKLAGLVLGFAGAVVVVTRGHLFADLALLPSTRGDLLILASTVNWAVYSVVGHPVLRRLGAPRATLGAMAAGFVILAVPVLWLGVWRDYARLGAAGWAAVLFLGLACSGLGYLFWYGALEKIEASRVAAFLYLEPLVTLAAAVALLGERVQAITVAGGLMLLLGVYLVERAPAPAKVALPATAAE